MDCRFTLPTLALLSILLIPISTEATQATMSPHGDAVMSTAQENQQTHDWAAQSFLSEQKKTTADSFVETGIPFSFTYGGSPSSKLLGSWPHTSETRVTESTIENTIRWSDPKTGLRVTAEVKTFKEYPAADWVLCFENTGASDTPILENIQAADLTHKMNAGLGMLHHLNGDDCGLYGQDAFAPVDRPIYKGGNARLAAQDGRPSSGSGFPFFNYEDAGKGIIMAIGWTGQWAASFDYLASGQMHIQAGMQHTHLLLHPGEKIRSPRIVMLNWSGDRTRAHNQFRRLMLNHYSPRQNDKPVLLPIALQNWDRYRLRPGWGTESGQLKGVESAHEMGCDTYWLDATWYAGGFPDGAGNWFVDTKAFPNGLKPISDACHKNGMRFILWFDPERVMPGTQIDREHPDWVLRWPNERGIFDLGNPEARRWLTELLSKRIEESGLDIYRQDSNIFPHKYWQAKDTPDRQGMSEIRHVEGLYEMWDELLARHPGLVIDNCSSGGRRIDIETCKRAVPLWRSDCNTWDCPQEWNQMQSLGLGLYVPLHTAGIQSPASYRFRGGATAGAVCDFGYLDPGFSKETAKASIAEARENQKYWYGDIYPLTNCNIATDHLMAFQLHRPDLDEGIVLAFRRPNCPLKGLIANLSGIHSDYRYTIELIDDSRKVEKRVISGKKLIADGLQIILDRKESSLLIRYKGKRTP